MVKHHLPTSTKPVDNPVGGEFIGWTVRKVVHPTGSNRLVDNPEVEERTMNLFFNVVQLSYKPSNFARANKPYAVC